YNRGGMLEKVAGHKDGMPYQYLDSIVYNEFEQRSEVFHGNGTHTLYVYDSLRRLLLLQSQTHAGDIMQDILYTYDSVSNITNITNSAGMLPNGLGGTYNSAYTYDDLYRLTSSTGGWQGSQNISYRTTTLYRGNGRIKQKNLAARTLLNGISDTVNYSHYYYYGNTSQPNTLTRYSSSVWDPGSWLSLSNEEDSQFGWDAAGNMTESCIGGDRNCRSLCWDEQNRLQGVKDNKWLSYYQYDAAGDRTYKLTGKGELQNINGEWRYFYHLDNATLYVSPYLVATKQGYTKHYYAETERIASRIGGGRLRYLDQPVVGQGKIVEKQSTNKTYAKEVLEECLDAIHSEGQADLHHLYDMINSAHSETDCYWYHPDHLGSSSWITDSAGTAVQHLHYLPWGEDFVDQRTTDFTTRFTFSAKERDSETGLSYFGSRYYSSDLSVWLSVDPMSDKYASLSPYVYCANNPVKLVDPNGDSIINPYKRLIDECNAVIMELEEGIKGQKYNDPSLAKAALATTKEELKEYIDYSRKVEIAISALKEDVDFYNTLNHLEDEHHTPVDIYIYINPNLPIEKGRNGECDEDVYWYFNSFCGFKGNKVGMILSGHEIGITACHEGGHIENDVKGYTTQHNWIISHGYANDPNYSGHEKDNPSGDNAIKREREYRQRHNIPYDE
ncbi:MAG: RHS repeat-associated core domain-containing protein, partial [Bacteroidales bacterium]|nr:RHS repeat-associated core domain-containing protein [Bacteroidales bacterium]